MSTIEPFRGDRPKTDDQLDRHLQHQRTKWLELVESGDSKGAGEALMIALSRCHNAERLLPQWLVEAIVQHLDPVTDHQQQQEAYDADELRRMQMLHEVVGSDEQPTEAHYRAAAARLNMTGDPVTAAAIKKTWQRHGDVFLAFLKLHQP